MKIKVLIYLFIFIFTKSFSQPVNVFKKYFLKNSYVAHSNDVLESSINNYVLFGFTQDTIGTQIHERMTLVGVDQIHNLSWKKSYGNNNFQYKRHIYIPTKIIKKDNFLYSALFAVDSNQKQCGVFVKFNFNGDTIWQKKYYINNDELFFMSVTPSADGGFLMTGAVQTNTPGFNSHPIVATYLLKTDASGNKLWDKRFYKSNLDEMQSGYKIMQDNISKNIIIAGVQDVGTMQLSNILFLDSLGILITQKGGDGLFGHALSDVIKSNDGNFVAVGTTVHPEQLVSNIATSASTFIKFDSNGNIIFKKEFDTLVINNSFTKVIQTTSGDFIVGGVLSTLFQHNLGLNDVSRIMRIDENGYLVWKKYFDNYTDNQNQDGLSGMNLTQDGNIVFTNNLVNGFEPPPIPYTIYITDTTSCDINSIGCYNFVGLKEIRSKSQKIVCFPNPANNYCKLKLSDLEIDAPVTIELRNILGETVFKNQTNSLIDYELNTSDFYPGIYSLILYSNKEILTEQKLILLK